MPPKPKSLDVENMATMYLSGASLQQVAGAFGVTGTTVRKRLIEHGVAIRRPGARDARAAQAHQRRLTDEQELEVAKRYVAGELIYELAAAFDVGRKTINNTLRRQGIQPRDKLESQAHMNRRRRERGERHPNFKGTPVAVADGYVAVSITDEDPMFVMASERGRLSNFGHGYVLEHRLVMARHLGRPLTSTETVHHKNGKRDDNRIENLQLRNGKHGKGSALCCGDCGSRNIVSEPI